MEHVRIIDRDMGHIDFSRVNELIFDGVKYEDASFLWEILSEHPNIKKIVFLQTSPKHMKLMPKGTGVEQIFLSYQKNSPRKGEIYNLFDSECKLNQLGLYQFKFTYEYPINLNITSLALSQCTFGEHVGLPWFCEWIRTTTSLKHLNMRSDKDIPPQIVRTLRYNRSITSLLIGQLNSWDINAVIRSNRTIRHLVIHGGFQYIISERSFCDNYTITSGLKDSNLQPFMRRNKRLQDVMWIPIWAARNREGSFSIISIDVARIITRMIYASRKEECWK